MARRRTGFTTRASCLLAAGVTAMLCGLLLGESDLVRAGVLAAAVPCVAAFVVHRSRVQVANRRSIDPPRATAGSSVVVHLTITNRSVLPSGALMLEDQLPDRLVGRARFVLDSLSGREARTVSYRMPNLGRGRYRAGPLRVRLSDPFHMIDLTRSFTATNDFVVTPMIDELPATEPARSDDLGNSTGSHSVGAHGADDASTREYRTGDDLRKIHWRSSARTGALMVRQEERPWRAQTTVLLDMRAGAHAVGPELDDADESDPRATRSFEWAVSAAASIGTQALSAGRVLDLIGDPGTSEPHVRFAQPDTFATYLAGVREVPAPSFDPIGRAIRTAARESALVAVLGRLDAAALRLLADAHPRGQGSAACALLLDVDSWGPAAVGGPDRIDPDKAAGVLRSAGWRITVVRRGMTTPLAWQLLLAGSTTRGGTQLAGATR